MILTERLRLYPATRGQMERFIAAEDNPPLRKAYAEMLDGCLRFPDQWDWYAMWMIELRDGTHIGDLCFKGLADNGAAEIGYGILEQYQGRGYAVEAVRAAAAWAFQDPRVRALEAETDPDNAASQKVLKNCGFVPTGTVGEEGPRYTLIRRATMYTLENEAIKIVIAEKGAELCSVTDKETFSERLWTADPAIWNRHAPILFPFVGKVTGGEYRIGGKSYSMKTQHGFARDLPFHCVETSELSVTYCLASSEETREIYPYDFRLLVTHSLDRADPRLLHIGWRLTNTGDERMYYAIGGHPGFLLPPGVKKEDCFLCFPGHETLRYFGANPEGFALPDKLYSLEPEQGYARYQADIPDTWIFADQGIREVGIALPDKTPYITLRCEQFPLLAVWANPKGSFICLEPWFGRTDDAGFTGTLAEKPGMETLAPGEERQISYSIRFHAHGTP